MDYWLGLKLSNGASRCPLCVGEGAADLLEDHQVGCGGNGDCIHRHDSLRDALFSAAQSAALVPRKEVPSLIPGTNSRPADIFLPNWCMGRPAALDVTVISTLQPLTLAGRCCRNSGSRAETVGEERKTAAYNEACLSVGVAFIPLVVETLGGLVSCPAPR